MENVSFENENGLTLRGLWQEGSTKKGIIMCHGFRSNRSSRGRFDRLASTFQEKGYSVLRFDFGGCGESDNRPLTLRGEVEDLTAAIEYVTEKGTEDLALFGHSLGARVCLEAYQRDRIKTMMFTGAGTGPVQYDWSAEFTTEQLAELADTGFLTQSVEDPFRSSIIIPEEMLRDFDDFDQEELLSRVACPVYLIHGDQGEEAILMPLTREGMVYLPKESQLTVFKGAAHDLMDQMNEIEHLACQWMKNFL
ncbi:alpha/beta hydrolase [Halobacillus litoralis]|uniref:alpha/beta hydrolase n=1 Tax=Halobacillus litoralis TaxID=45668 RepID=UPI001CD7A84F|nr:alpha/beta hydrolase [Halobacillus litoralis]MCA0971220.1 alpha/beta hydrolase [Halobacillus litoralis]